MPRFRAAGGVLFVSEPRNRECSVRDLDRSLRRFPVGAFAGHRGGLVVVQIALVRGYVVRGVQGDEESGCYCAHA